MEFNWDPRRQRRTIRVCARTKNSLRERGSFKEESPSSRRRRPISCKYTGVIPDAVGLCAKLYSDFCNPPKRIFYSVSNCHNPSEVYEESEYTVRRRLCRLTTAINQQQIRTRKPATGNNFCFFLCGPKLILDLFFLEIDRLMGSSFDG